MKPLRSVRAAIVAGALVLLLTPFALLGVGLAYEAWLSFRNESQLRAVAARLAAGEGAALVAHGTRTHVRLLGPDGAEQGSDGSDVDPLEYSPIGGLIERVLGTHEDERFADVDRAMGPTSARYEVRTALHGDVAFAERVSRSGRSVTYHLAAPRPGGGAFYLARGSRRGTRQLLLMRREFVKLVLYETFFVLAFALVLARRVARPIEQLATAAQRFPLEPLEGSALLKRPDEIGELARSMAAMAEDLERRRRATADLGADVAHEFKNPLATIAASAELIATPREVTLERRKMVAGHLADATERLRRSIDALLALLRLEVSLPDEPRERVDYERLIESVLESYRTDPRYADLRFVCDVDASVGEVVLVPRRWSELLRNLLDNAVVQPSTRREVHVIARRERARLVTSVRDFGPGVSEGNRANVFRRFFTQRPAGVEPGTGLGLSIVGAVAAAHGGDVRLESSAGEGATFVVSIPA